MATTLDHTKTSTVCPGCGSAIVPGGDCLNVGVCVDADKQASKRSHSGKTTKFTAPVAFSIRGRVD